MLNLKHLYYFHIFAQEMSTTKAAARLHISSPALSNQLKELDAYLGFKLTERVNGKFQVTDQGQMVLEYTDCIFSPYEELRNKISSKVDFKSEHLQIGISSFLDADYSMEQIIGTAILRSPGVKKTSLIYKTPAKLMTEFNEGKLNMIVGSFTDDWYDENIWVSKEMKCPVQLVAPIRLLESLKYEKKEYLLTDIRGLIQFAETLKILIVLPVESVLREETDRFLRNSGIVLTKVMECNTANGMSQLISHKVAMGFMPVASMVEQQDLSKVSVLGPIEGYWNHRISVVSLKEKGPVVKGQVLDSAFSAIFSNI